MNLKLFASIITFIVGTAGWLGLVYVLNYALVEQDSIMYSMIPTSYLPLYQLFNYLWTGILFAGIIGLFIKSLPADERLFG